MLRNMNPGSEGSAVAMEELILVWTASEAEKWTNRLNRPKQTPLDDSQLAETALVVSEKHKDACRSFRSS